MTNIILTKRHILRDLAIDCYDAAERHDVTSVQRKQRDHVAGVLERIALSPDFIMFNPDVIEILVMLVNATLQTWNQADDDANNAERTERRGSN